MKHFIRYEVRRQAIGLPKTNSSVTVAGQRRNSTGLQLAFIPTICAVEPFVESKSFVDLSRVGFCNELMNVQIEALRKTYGAYSALSDVTFTIPSGAVLALAGPNGAGKTTLMKIISGLSTPTSGSVRIGDLDVIDNPREAHRYLGFLGDFFGLYDDLTVREFLLYFARAYSLKENERESVVESLIQKCHLGHKADAQIKALSRGLRQRVGIARTLINNPPIILLDEPSAGLDPEARADLQNLFRELGAEGKTLIVSSHILTELEDYCSHVALLNKGQLISFGEIREIARTSQQKRKFEIELIDGAEKAESTFQSITAVSDWKRDKNIFTFHFEGDESKQADLLQTLVQNGVRLIRFEEQSGRIQEAYLTHMKGSRE
jgi:ABC-2 type transport system ATP-binding protein